MTHDLRTTSLPDPIVRIIVCGNADRGDDGAALSAIATLLPTLPHRLLSKVEIRRCPGFHVEDLVDLPRDVVCLVLDAVAGVEPGQVVRTTMSDLRIRPAFTARSSHELPIDLVIGLAGIIRKMPVVGTFVGLGGYGFDYGAPLSKVVRAALPAYGEAIAGELALLTEVDLGVGSRSSPPRTTSPM